MWAATRPSLFFMREKGTFVMGTADHHKRTKIVATIGPASQHPGMLRDDPPGWTWRASTSATAIWRLMRAISQTSAAASRSAGRRHHGGLAGPKRAWAIQRRAARSTEQDRVTSRRPTRSIRSSRSCHRTPTCCAISLGDLIDDGQIEMVIESKTGANVTAEVIIGGELRSRKGVSVPDTVDAVVHHRRRPRACRLRWSSRLSRHVVCALRRRYPRASLAGAPPGGRCCGDRKIEKAEAIVNSTRF